MKKYFVPKWDSFYEMTAGKPPRPLLLKGLKYVSRKDKALDIGAGGLNETKYLLDQGFQVTALDGEPSSAAAAKRMNNEKLHFYKANFEDFTFPTQEFDLAVALYTLQFTPRQHFDRVVKAVLDSIKPEGIFVGNLFGEDDEWNNGENQVNFVNETTAKAFFRDFNVLEWKEEKGPQYTDTGEMKYWHIYHIIAQRN